MDANIFSINLAFFFLRTKNYYNKCFSQPYISFKLHDLISQILKLKYKKNINYIFNYINFKHKFKVLSDIRGQ